MAEVHVAFGVGGVAEAGLAHGAGEGGEEEVGGGLVVPDVRAGAEAQTLVVANGLYVVNRDPRETRNQLKSS